MTTVKEKPYTDLNPNGRAPTIEDPNTGVVIWETGAIILYLIETYDKEDKLNISTAPEKHLLHQWLCFQISGQGPYFGQVGWFLMFHSEKLPSAVSRYTGELRRIVSVLDTHLAKQSTPYLVGDKCTYVDLAYITYNELIPMFMQGAGEKWDASEYPHFKKWHENLMARPIVAKVMAEQQDILKKELAKIQETS